VTLIEVDDIERKEEKREVGTLSCFALNRFEEKSAKRHAIGYEDVMLYLTDGKLRSSHGKLYKIKVGNKN